MMKHPRTFPAAKPAPAAVDAASQQAAYDRLQALVALLSPQAKAEFFRQVLADADGKPGNSNGDLPGDGQ